MLFCRSVNIVEGYSDLILGASPNNTVINEMVSYIKINLNTFQNGIMFKKSINTFLNKLLANSSNHSHNDSLVTNISSCTNLGINHLFSGGGHLRITPKFLIDFFTKNLNKEDQIVNFYVHPREFIKNHKK